MVGYLGESHAPQDCPVSGPGLTQAEPNIHLSTQNQDTNDIYVLKRRNFIKVSLAEWLWRVTQAIRFEELLNHHDREFSHGLSPQGFESVS